VSATHGFAVARRLAPAIAIAAALLAAAPARAQVAPPVIDATVDGFDYAGDYLPGQPIPVEIALQCNDACGESADWWVWAVLPQGRVLRYDGAAGAWVRNDAPDPEAPSFQQPLADLARTTLPGTLTLPPGVTYVHFAIDLLPDGVRQLPGGDYFATEDSPVWVYTAEGFYEDFDDGRANRFAHDGGSSWRVARRRYRLEARNDYAVSWALRPATPPDFEYGADVRCVAGDADTLRRGMGIIFRAGRNYDDGYVFHVNARGYFTIFRRDRGATVPLMSGWKFSPAIRRGFGKWNRLDVLAWRSRMVFRVNGVVVKRLRDATYSSGRAGVKAFGSAASGDRFEFDNLALRAFYGE